MRKWIILSLAMWFGIGIGTAYADVTVFATIDKDKDKFVFEQIDKFKHVDLFVTVDVNVIKAAESDALVNQRNDFNEACENCAEKRDFIENSGNTNSGIVTVNQAAGNMNNQASAVSVAIDVRVPNAPPDVPVPDPDDRGFAEAQAAADQRNENNLVESVNLLFRDAIIRDSFSGNTGVVHVNQAAGNMANQANVLSMAVAFTPGVALSEADLGQVNAFNTVLESDSGTTLFGVHKSAEITNSVNGNTGIIGVNQSSGNMANQANVVSFAATQSPVTP